LAVEGGADTNVVVQDGARLLQIEPGETDLKKAQPLQLSDLQTGDRILVRGGAGPDGKSILAASVIAMKKADLAAKHAHDQAEWTRHGIGGLVGAVDATAGTITVSTSALGANKSILVHVSKNTVLRRYAPGSVKFDDAQPAPLDQIKSGDQLRARGQRSPDGGELTADEVVSGSFRNISGTINSIDTGASTITVQDLTTKKPVVVKIADTAQLRKLPAPMAQRIAARLKGGSGDAQASEGAAGGAGAPSAPAGTPPAGNAGARAPASGSPLEQKSGDSGGQRGAGGANGGSGRSGAGGQGGDLQQAISRMPASNLSDLQKGDAVMIVATSDSGASGSVVAITLLSGVEPILQASPSGQSILTPWSMSSAPGGDAAQ
jgi:ribosomal protein L24